MLARTTLVAVGAVALAGCTTPADDLADAVDRIGESPAVTVTSDRDELHLVTAEAWVLTVGDPHAPDLELTVTTDGDGLVPQLTGSAGEGALARDADGADVHELDALAADLTVDVPATVRDYLDERADVTRSSDPAPDGADASDAVHVNGDAEPLAELAATHADTLAEYADDDTSGWLTDYAEDLRSWGARASVDATVWLDDGAVHAARLPAGGVTALTGVPLPGRAATPVTVTVHDDVPAQADEGMDDTHVPVDDFQGLLRTVATHLGAPLPTDQDADGTSDLLDGRPALSDVDRIAEDYRQQLEQLIDDLGEDEARDTLRAELGALREERDHVDDIRDLDRDDVDELIGAQIDEVNALLDTLLTE